jgi:hypothetical protein
MWRLEDAGTQEVWASDFDAKKLAKKYMAVDRPLSAYQCIDLILYRILFQARTFSFARYSLYTLAPLKGETREIF